MTVRRRRYQISHYGDRSKILTNLAYISFSFSLIYYLLHIGLIDILNTCFKLSTLDMITSIPDSFEGGGYLINAGIAIIFAVISIYFLLKYDQNFKVTLQKNFPFLSFSLIVFLIVSIFSIIMTYDFIRIFLEVYPLNESILAYIFWIRVLIVMFFIVSIFINSFCFGFLFFSH